MSTKEPKPEKDQAAFEPRITEAPWPTGDRTGGGVNYPHSEFRTTRHRPSLPHFFRLERNLCADLRGERNPDRRSRSEEIAQRPSGRAQLFQARDGSGRRTGGVGTEVGDVASRHFRRWDQQRADIRNIVRAGIVTVEEIEEFD